MAKPVSRYISELLDKYQEITKKVVLKWQWTSTPPFPTSISIKLGEGAQGQKR